jgi:tRNA G37 N-methylase TrmD
MNKKQLKKLRRKKRLKRNKNIRKDIIKYKESKKREKQK